MSIEAEKTFRDSAREKGKKVIRRTVRTIQGIAVAAALGGGISLGMHLQEDGKVKNSINTQVLEENPRKVTEEDYKLAKREVTVYNRTKDTTTINEPPQIAEYKQQIEEEDARSQDLLQKKDKLMNEHKARVGHRTIKDGIFIALSGIIIMAPILYEKISGKYRIKPHTPVPIVDS